MNTNLFTGQLVRLSRLDPEKTAALQARWGADSTYQRLLDNEPARLWSAAKYQEWREKNLDRDQTLRFLFDIITLAEERTIGFIALAGIQWTQGEGWVGIGIGERDYWGKGYGTDAMRILLRFAFTELNLHRVSLGLFAYNERALRSYEKAGFRVEGQVRGSIARDGQRSNEYWMGILRREWEALYPEQAFATSLPQEQTYA